MVAASALAPPWNQITPTAFAHAIRLTGLNPWSTVFLGHVLAAQVAAQPVRVKSHQDHQDHAYPQRNESVSFHDGAFQAIRFMEALITSPSAPARGASCRHSFLGVSRRLRPGCPASPDKAGPRPTPPHPHG